MKSFQIVFNSTETARNGNTTRNTVGSIPVHVLVLELEKIYFFDKMMKGQHLAINML